MGFATMIDNIIETVIDKFTSFNLNVSKTIYYNSANKLYVVSYKYNRYDYVQCGYVYFGCGHLEYSFDDRVGCIDFKFNNISYNDLDVDRLVGMFLSEAKEYLEKHNARLEKYKVYYDP